MTPWPWRVKSFKQDKGRVLTTVQRLMPTTEPILFMHKSMQINNSSQARSFVGVGLSPSSSSSSVEGSKLHQDFEINRETEWDSFVVFSETTDDEVKKIDSRKNDLSSPLTQRPRRPEREWSKLWVEWRPLVSCKSCRYCQADSSALGSQLADTGFFLLSLCLSVSVK